MQTPVAVAAGETNAVTLTATGPAVAVQLHRPASLASVSWSRALATLSRDVPCPPEPAQGEYLSDDSLAAARWRYTRDPSVRAALRQMRTYIGAVDDEGIVRFEHVPPGRYILDVKLFVPRADSPPTSGFEESPVAASLHTAVLIPEANGVQRIPAPMSLGEFVLQAQ